MVNSLPSDIFKKNPNFDDPQPRTIHISLPVPSNLWEILGEEKMRGIMSQVPEIKETDKLDEAVADSIDEQFNTVARDAVKLFHSRYDFSHTTTGQFDNITLEVVNVPDTVIDAGCHEHNTNNYIAKINNTYIGYPNDDVLKAHLPELITLTDCHQKVQEDQNHPLSNCIVYDKDAMHLAANRNENGCAVNYGNSYFKYSDKPAFYTEYGILHELTHVRNGDLDPDSPQNKAIFALAKYIGIKKPFEMSPVMGALFRAKYLPEDMAIRLLNLSPDLDRINELLEDLDELYTNIKPAVAAAAKHMKDFHGFRNYGANNIAIDMEQGKNRFLDHISRIPSIEEQYIGDFTAIRAMHKEVLNSPKAGAVPDSNLAKIKDESSFDNSQKAQLIATLQTFASKHADLLGSFLTLNTSMGRIRRAMEIRADLGMSEMADHPEMVPEIFEFFDKLEEESKERLGTRTYQALSKENDTHPDDEDRFQDTTSHARFLKEIRSEAARGM